MSTSTIASYSIRTAKWERTSQTFQAQLRAFGCFILSDCFSERQIASIHLALTKLFLKNGDEKAKYFVDKRSNPLDQGFSPYGTACAMDTQIPNLLETWDIGPDMLNWPLDLAYEWKLVFAFQQTLYDIGLAALELIAIALEIEIKELTELVHPQNGGIHLIHYFPVPKNVPRGARRQSEHCDNTLITLIPPPSPLTSGLSVYNRNLQRWEDCVLQTDQCLVQAGLLLQRITAGAIPANLHTVQTPEYGAPTNVSRYSTPFFLSPGPDVMLKLLSRFRTYSTLTSCPDVRVLDLQRKYFERIFGKD